MSLYEKLVEISGIGDKVANELIAAGLRSLHELPEKKYFEMLPEESKLEIKYGASRGFSREYITQLIKYLPGDSMCVGSYRRELPKINDLDIVTLSNLTLYNVNLRAIAQVQKTLPGGPAFEILGQYAAGEKKISYLLKLNAIITKGETVNIRVDIFNTTMNELPFALMHHTGSKHFNIKTRVAANNRGNLILNQYGLFDSNGNPTVVKGEKGIFEALNLPFKEPKDRV